MKKRIIVFLSILIFLLLVISLKNEKLKKSISNRGKVLKLFDVKIYANKEIFCYGGTCSTKDGKIKIIPNKNGFTAYIKEENIKIEIPAEYIVIKIDGREYYRKIQKNEELKLLKEFLLYGKGKYEIKLENGLQGRYPILFSTENSTYIDMYFDNEGKLIFRKYL